MKKLFVLSTLSLSLGAFANSHNKVCEGDIKKFKCKGDDKAIHACLAKHEKDLTEGCKAHHAEKHDDHGAHH